MPQPDLRGQRDRRWPRRLAAGYAAATLVALAAWTVAGDAWWLQPVNLTTFWWSLPGLVLLPVALWRRRWWTAVLLGVPAGLFLWAYGTLFVPTAANAGELRIATQNVYIRTPDVGHVVALAERERPDVLVVQELLPRRTEELVAALAERYPHRWFGDPGTVGGLGVLSRHPIAAVRPIPTVFRHGRPTAVVEVDLGGRRVQVVPVHLISPCLTCGDSPARRVAFEGSVRAAEITAVLSALDPHLPAIVAGDLNSTDRSDPYRELAAAGFRDPQRERGSGPGFTWPAHRGPGAVLRIDWILVRGLEPTRAVVAPPDASDHRAVIVDVDLGSG